MIKHWNTLTAIFNLFLFIVFPPSREKPVDTVQLFSHSNDYSVIIRCQGYKDTEDI